MKIGILAAGDREIAPVLAGMAIQKSEKRAMLSFHAGTFGGAEVVALFSGVGKVNAAVAAQILIDRYQVDAILNVGTAGGVDESLRLFDLAVTIESAHHDVAAGILTNYHPWMEDVWFRSDPRLVELSRSALTGQERVFWGRTVTGECFLEDEGRPEIIETFHPLAVDMETAAIAHVCHVNGIPFLALRAITDTAEHIGTGAFEENCDKASGIAAEAAEKLLRKMSATENLI